MKFLPSIAATLAVTACGWTSTTGARADVFYLANGGEIRGQLLNVDQEPRESYVVRTDDGARLILASSQVRRFVPKSPERRHYEALLPRMPQSAQGHWKMAQWCREQGLEEEREHHLHEVLRHDANHKDARLALGYTSLDGEWIKTDEWNRRQGYVYYQGKWQTPQEVELLTLQQKLDEAQRQFRPDLKRWRGWLESRNRDRQQQGLANIRGVKDPLAATTVAALYDDEELPAVRRLWIEVLGKLPGGMASDTLAKAAVEDGDANVREAARDSLEERGDRRAIGALLAELKSTDNKKVNRAAAALARINDMETFLPLVDALVTEHKFIVTRGQGGGIGATFSPTGGTSFNPGGGPKLEKHKLNNRDVLNALVQLTVEHRANFGYDAEKWKEWYADLHTPDEVNLRRDP